MASRNEFFDPFVYEEIHQGDSNEPELGSPEYDFYTPSNGLQGAPGDVARRVPAAPWEIPITFSKGVEACYLNKGEKTTYWLSLDKENGRIRYGKYYTNAKLTLAEVSLKTRDDKGVLVWKEPETYNWLERLKPFSVTLDKGATKPEIVVQPVAVVMGRSPFVVSSDKISLVDLERGAGTVPANLPLGCQTLYGNVAGAIERSCRNPDGWCYKKLVEKAVPHEGVSGQNFAHKKPDMTYLRITIGENQVLHGEIEATYYDSLNKQNVIGTAKFPKGGITWIGPQDFQIHKLHNKSPRVCCTIQCYRYEKRDKVHYEYFNFADDNLQSKPFTPNSDMSFLDFRQVMMREWEEECRKVGNE
ncbi:unnamed protein product [Parascedosporium putredinis]|uniref:Uncharacterized protein n=1 Tax=Parascedosporium putredinis TaxID=1442378 RepID=A0A9P1H1Y2_9PEZI|nr:unnamed protein product [Parascedosporium putredinis]CAI7994097.1 unnamed protein product [Parascedosporium putredinis]